MSEMNSTLSAITNVTVNAVTTVPPETSSATYYVEPNPSKIFRLVVYALLFLFAVVGNIAVCVVPIRQKRMRTFTYFLITNLAVSDIGTMLCLPPLLVFNYSGTWSMGQGMCKLVNPSLTMFSLITTNTLVAIAIDRFMSLVFPFVRRPQTKETILVVSLTWLLAFACVLPSFGARVIIPYVEKGKTLLYCGEIFPGDTQEDQVQHKKVYDVALYLINNTLPILIISVVYIIIIFKLKGISVSKAFKRKSSLDEYSKPGALTSDDVYLKQKNERERKFTQMLLSVVVVFVIFYVPVQTLFLLNTLVPSTSVWYYLAITYDYLYLMMWFPNALNPILYGSMNEQYSKALKKILRCRLGRMGKDNYASTMSSTYTRAPQSMIQARNEVVGSTTRDTEMTLMA